MGLNLVTLGRFLGRLFRERQIYHRSDGVVRFMKLTSRAQVTMTLLLVTTIIWVAFASVNVVFKEQIINANEEERKQQIDAYRTQVRSSEKAYNSINELNVIFSQEYEAAVSQLETRHEALRGLVENKNDTDQGLSDLAQSLSEIDGPRDRKIKNGNRVMIDPTGREPTPRQNRTSRIRQKSLAHAITSELSRGVKSDVLAKMRVSTAELTTRQTLLLAKIEADVKRDIGELRQIIRSTGITEEALTVPALRAYAARRSGRYAARALDEGGALEGRALEGTLGDKPGRVAPGQFSSVQENGDTSPPSDEIYSGRGGPFIEADGDPGEPDDRFFAVTQRATDILEEAAVVSGIVEGLPLSTPLSVQYRLSSNYGLRRDPKNHRRTAHHEGLDLASAWNTPIIATAPGRIKFAGYTSGGFGLMVKIDHENGFETWYAHLNKIRVKAGQRVDLHETVGLLGSSGRSTGPHVHYEVRFNGKPIDPLKFIEAGRYVFES